MILIRDGSIWVYGGKNQSAILLSDATLKPAWKHHHIYYSFTKCQDPDLDFCTKNLCEAKGDQQQRVSASGPEKASSLTQSSLKFIMQHFSTYFCRLLSAFLLNYLWNTALSYKDDAPKTGDKRARSPSHESPCDVTPDNASRHTLQYVGRACEQAYQLCIPEKWSMLYWVD